MVEDSGGFLWIGTASGLSRYDGQVFDNYDTEHGLPSSRIYSLLEDTTGRLWAGTDRGVAYLHKDGWQAAFDDSPTAGLRILALAEDITSEQPGDLLIGTRRGGLYQVRQGVVSAVPLTDSSLSPSSPEATSVFALQAAGGFLWVGTDRGLLRLAADDDGADDSHGHRLRAQAFEAPWAEASVGALAVDADGRLLVANGQGAFAIEPSDGTWLKLVDGLSGDLKSLASGGSGELWAGTHRRGLLLATADGEQRLTTLQGLPTDSIRALLRHSDGGLWVGTYGSGVCRLNDLAFALFESRHGLPNERVLGLAEAPDGALWVGMLEGGVARFDGRDFQTFDLKDGLRSLAVSYLLFDPDGTLWVATLRGGLHRFTGHFDNGGRFEPVELPGIDAPSIFHLSLDDARGLWIASWGAGVVRLDLDGGAPLAIREWLLSRQIFATSQAADGKLWIAMPNGVQTLDPTSLEVASFEPEQQPPQGRVRGIVHDDSGRTFLATDLGLSLWDGDRFHILGRPQGLVSNDLYLVTLDRLGRLWLGSERGLDRLRIDASGHLEELRHFGVSEGFLGLETNQNAVLEDRQGNLWFGTRGLARFDPSGEPPPPAAPAVELTGLHLLDDTPIPLHGDTPLRLLRHQNNLVFGLLAIDFVAPEAVRYRYRLQGLGDEWSPPSSSRLAVFPQLEPGDYRFEVAASRQGDWGPSRHLDFVVLPAWWATWWFRAGALGTMVLLLLLSLWRRAADQRRQRRRLEEAVEDRTRELVAAKQVAEAASAAKSDFLSNMSHELRTPLTGVVSAAELIGNQGLDSRQQHLVETIQASGRALLSVVNDILDQAKIEARGLQMDSRPFSPRVCVEECAEMVRHSAELKNLVLTSHIAPDLPQRLMGDPVRFRQVLINLLGNAIKFTDAGHIDVTISVASKDDDHCRLLVEVRDTGIGISGDVQQQIFQPFEQADASPSRNFGGTGLGLSICDRLVAMMGGSIEVESVLGEGSVFRFDARFEWPNAQDLAEPAADLGMPAIRSGLRVLLAEDNPVSQLITTSQLETLGIQPHLASDGAEAVRMIQKMQPDLVFMDGQMPVMDGYAATQAVRAEEADDRHVIIVGFTAHATEDAPSRCLDVGMDDYLAKPVSLESLAQCLARWFPDNPGALDG